MAQTMLLMSGHGVSTYNGGADIRRYSLPLLPKLKPRSSMIRLFNPLAPSSSSSLSSSVFVTRAQFKSKTKAAPVKGVEKSKSKVEDGIFGTSGGIGFTKQNELFVGRVAMIGFAGNPREQEGRDPEAKPPNQEEAQKFAGVVPLVLTALIMLSSMRFSSASLAQTIDIRRGASLFEKSCIGCHYAGGNIIQPGATLFNDDLKKNGVDSEEEIYRITYYGKGRMPGFGEKCTPRGQCTFGPRLKEEEIKLLSEFVKLKADQGWKDIE